MCSFDFHISHALINGHRQQQFCSNNRRLEPLLINALTGEVKFHAKAVFRDIAPIESRIARHSSPAPFDPNCPERCVC